MLHNHEMFEKGMKAFFDDDGLAACPPISDKHDEWNKWLEGYRFGQSLTLADKLLAARDEKPASHQGRKLPADDGRC